MEMTLYPPYGTRGFGPMRALDYNAQNAIDYVKKDSLKMCRFVQIESVSMIDDLEEIAQNPFIDGFIFGPNDLSGSVGDFLNVFGDNTVNEIKRAVDILRKYDKKTGIACGYSPECLSFWSQFDFDIVFAGADWNFLYDKAKSTLDVMKDHIS